MNQNNEPVATAPELTLAILSCNVSVDTLMVEIVDQSDGYNQDDIECVRSITIDQLQLLGCLCSLDDSGLFINRILPARAYSRALVAMSERLLNEPDPDLAEAILGAIRRQKTHLLALQHAMLG